ncbi:hypothetical protein NDU88_003044 [Pleurodeles waltl]|uniref:Uncharacterized protein n=1 Tax=Pleurodeles waltl TaxID=8319 RepID=A0AAV7UCN4_PLEWA|nr:hypothetical protein NDU88_003044 [Pleurodeles waltl]
MAGASWASADTEQYFPGDSPRDETYSGLHKEIEHYFRDNKGTVQSNITLWAAGNATIRGHAKAILRRQEHEKQAHITSLEAWEFQLERKLMAMGEETTKRALELVR